MSEAASNAMFGGGEKAMRQTACDLESEAALLRRGGFLSDDEASVIIGPDLGTAARLVGRFAQGW
jgi:hypothetical protein